MPTSQDIRTVLADAEDLLLQAAASGIGERASELREIALTRLKEAKEKVAPVRVTVNQPDAFREAVRAISSRIGVPNYDADVTLTEFEMDTPGLLDQARDGWLGVVSRGNERFLILSEEQTMAIAAASNRGRTVAEAFDGLPTVSTRGPRADQTVADVFAGLPSLPSEGPRPRATSLASPDQYRLPR
jgi:hypothetical protein